MMQGSGAKNYKQIGEEVWKRTEKINGDFFALTYGVFVAQLLKDLEDPHAVNVQLDKMGYSMGIRLIDELLAKTGVGRCTDFRETAEIIKLAFRIFLNVIPGVVVNDDQELTISMPIEGDALGSEFVELPEKAIKGGLHYSNILCGVIRGALEMVRMQVECTITGDPLLNASCTTTDVKVKFVKLLEENLPSNDD